MFGGAIFLFGAVIAAVVFLVWRFGRHPQVAVLSDRIAPVVAAARRRALVAVAFALVVFFAGAAVTMLLPGLFGLPLAVAAPVAGAAGLLLYAATPPRAVGVDDGQPRSAGLTRRTWISTIPKRWLRIGIGVIVLFVAVVILCGLTASDDEYGLSRSITFEGAGVRSTAGPYPGWYYGIPALIALAVLVVAVVVALQRIGSTAAFPDRSDADSDEQWRRASASVILRLAAGSALFTVGGLAAMAGAMMAGTATGVGAPMGWVVTGVTLTCLGYLLLVLSVVSVTLAILTSHTIGEKLARTPEQVR